MTVAVLQNKPSLTADLPVWSTLGVQSSTKYAYPVYWLKTRVGADFINTQNNEVINKTLWHFVQAGFSSGQNGKKSFNP